MNALVPYSTAALAACALACGAPQGSQGGMSADPLRSADKETLFQQGRAYAQAGDFVRAEQYIVASMDKGYPRDEATPVLIEICIAGSRYDTALHHARPYLAQHPENDSLRYLVGTLHNAVGQGNLAVQEWKRVLASSPDNTDVIYSLADLYWSRGDRETAVPYMRRYLELVPEGSKQAEVRARLTLWDESTEGDSGSPGQSNESALSEDISALVSDAPMVAAGKALFAKHCVVCHGPQAEGKRGLGPNLTDNFWIYGGGPLQIYNTVYTGTEKGMPAWQAQLGGGALKQVTAYLVSVRNTNVRGQKPQGKPWSPGPKAGEPAKENDS